MRCALVLCLTLIAFGTADAAAAKSPIPGIRTPSGRISCLALPQRPVYLYCFIRSPTYLADLQHRCVVRDGIDWVGWELGPTGRGTIACSGGILWSPDRYEPVYRTLAYGRTWRSAGFTCASERTGLTCRNGHGHGLFVSRESWRAW